MSVSPLRFLWFLISLLGFSSCLLGQSSAYFYRTITEKQGLSQIQVNDILQDPQGMIWIATDYGLNRFDGYDCTVFQVDKTARGGIADNQITALYVQGQQEIWMAMGNGRLQKLNTATLEFQPASPIAPDWRSEPLIEIYQDAQQRLWVLGYHGKVWTYLPESRKWRLAADLTSEVVAHAGRDGIVNPMLVDDDLWIHLQGGNIYKLEGDSLYLKFTKEDICAAAKADSCNYWDWWFATQRGPQNSHIAIHLPVIDGGRKFSRTVSYDLETGKSRILLESSALAVLLYSDTARLYIRPQTKAAEILEVNVKSGHVDTLTVEQDGVGKMLNATPYFLDRSGMLWGSYSKGVFYFDRSPPFALYNPETPSAGRRVNLQSIRSIQENPFVPGSFYISGYPSGTVLFLPGTGTVDWEGKPHSGMISRYVLHCIVPIGKNDVFTGREWSGLGRWQPRSDEVEYLIDTIPKAGKPGSARNTYSMLREGDRLWYGNNSGLYLLDLQTGDRQYQFTHLSPGEFHGECNAILRHSDGDLYVGTTQGLIWVNDRDQQSAVVDLRLPDHPAINCLHGQSGKVLWVGTSDQGVLRLQVEQGQVKEMRQWKKGQGGGAGLADNRICGILESENVLWISTYDGLSRMDLSDERFCNFYRESGLQDNEFNRFAYHKATDGRMMFGGIGGLTVFDPAEVRPEQSPSQVVLSRVEKNNRPVSLTAFQKGVFDLYPGDRRFLFQFTTDDYFSPDQVRFRYKIAPLDTAWSTLRKDRTLEFENTRVGEYDIEVQATDRYGRWSPGNMRFRLIVHPHWYETRGFLVSCIIAALLLAVLLGWWRSRRSNQRARALEKVVEARTAEISVALAEREVLLKEIHHRVKNNLMSIYSILSLQARRLPSGKVRAALEDARNRIHSMARLHQQVYEVDNLEQIDFPKYVQDLADSIQRSLDAGGTDIRIDCNIAPLVLDLQHALALGMIINELISNSYKHAFQGREEGKIQVELEEIGKGKWELTLRDDGLGLSEPIDWDNLSSMGLLLVFQWVTKIKGQIEAQSENGTAFFVRFEV